MAALAAPDAEDGRAATMAVADTEAEAEAKTDAKTDAKTEAGAGAGAEAEAEAEAKTDAKTGAGAGAEAKTDAKTDAKTEAGADAETETVHGHSECLRRASLLLAEMGLPDGLLPLQEIDEVGFVRGTGYFWVKQRRRSEHVFELINTRVAYAQRVCGFLEKNRLRKLQGVKVKELGVLWVSLGEISTPSSRPAFTYFKAIGVLGKYLPTSAFLLRNNLLLPPPAEAPTS